MVFDTYRVMARTFVRRKWDFTFHFKGTSNPRALYEILDIGVRKLKPICIPLNFLRGNNFCPW